MQTYTAEYKGYLINGRPATREIDRVSGKGYEFRFTIAKGSKDVCSVRVVADPADIDPYEPHTRGPGFGIPEWVWKRLRDAGLPEVLRMIDQGRLKEGSTQVLQFAKLAAAAYTAPVPTPRHVGVLAVHGPAHATPLTYVKIGTLLTLITLIEVGVFYMDYARSAFILTLVALSALKFALVVMFYMHLRFDNRLFAGFFVFGLTVAVSIMLSLMGLFGTF